MNKADQEKKGHGPRAESPLKALGPELLSSVLIVLFLSVVSYQKALLEESTQG